jgi:hypothetical protein
MAAENRIRGRMQETRERHGQRGPVASSLSTKPGRRYGSGYDDATVDAMAARAGGGSLNDNDIWGSNADQTRPLDELNAGHEVNAHLIGHGLRGELVEVYDELDYAVPAAQDAESQAKENIDDHTIAKVEQEECRQKIKQEGLAFPHWIAHSVLYVLALLGLVVGDLAFIAVAYQLFGLSDERLLPFLPLSDELHLGASASVGALVVLAHVAGKRIREVMHDINRRRKAPDVATRQALPEPSRVSMAIAAICIVAGVVLLGGIADIRTGYLGEKGVDARALAFACIQFGIFMAALALAIAHAHPYGREWVDLGRRVRDAAKQMQASVALHVAAVGRVDGLIDRGNAILAQAGHHLGASRQDVVRQGARFAWVAQLHYPEPVSEHTLLPDSLPQPKELSQAQAAEFLIGITGLPEIKRMSTDPVTQHREQARALIERLRRAWIDQTWPEAKEPDAETGTGQGKTVIEVESEQVTVKTPPEGAAEENGGGERS